MCFCCRQNDSIYTILLYYYYLKNIQNKENISTSTYQVLAVEDNSRKYHTSKTILKRYT